MKKKVSPFYMLSMLLILVCTALPSCDNDYLPQSDETALMVLSLEGVSTRAEENLIYDGDNQINRVRIFVFTGDVLELNKLFVEGEDDFRNPFVVDVATGAKDLFVVANEGEPNDPLSLALAAVTTKAELSALMAKQIDSPLSLPLLMTGTKKNVTVQKQENSVRNEVTVTLTRVAAKIVLRFKKETDADVKITKMNIINNTAKSTLWENTPQPEDQSYWDFHHNYGSTPLTLSRAVEDSMIVYVYENITGGDKDKATQLEVEALYNNVQTKYRVYINENVSVSDAAGNPSSSVTNPSDHLYSLKRNHQYNLIGTIVNIGEFDGLVLETNVLPWEKVSSGVVYDWEFTITPYPSPAEKVYTVNSPTDAASFTFTLSKPVGVSWTANVSNPIDFEIKSDEGNISVSPKKEQGSTERSTEFYINVNFIGNITEIPLINGNKQTGTGNRIVIKQEAK